MNRRRLLTYVLIAMAGVAAALLMGKDQNWDSLSYHLYAGYSAIENRFGQDYFAASMQGYLNPYSHVPFYLMVKQGLAPQLIVAALALFHVLNLFLVYEIAIVLNRRQNGTVAWAPVWLAVFFTFVSPVFLTELGNTFNEVTTSVPVLAGWYLLIREFEDPRRSRLALAGAWIGIGVALKLTNLYFAVTVLPLLLLAPTSWKARCQAVLIVAGGGLLGLLLAGGWWAWQLWEQFGNPVFPMFNQIFHSPEFTDSPFKHYRFISPSLLETLLKPLAIAIPLGMTQVEYVAADIRYAALFVLSCLIGLKYALARVSHGKWISKDPFPAFQGNRALLALATCFVLAWFVWIFTSGNGRYFFPMACLASVVLASLVFRFSGQWRFLAYISVPMILAQAGLALHSNALRWTPVGWGQAWFELDIPAELQQPHLFLHMSDQTASFLMPFLPKESSMITASGMVVLEENAKIRALLDKHRGRVRVMRRYKGQGEGPEAEEYNFSLARFGLEADMATCLPIRLKVRTERYPEGLFSKYMSCNTKPRSWTDAQRDAFLAQQRRVNALFDRLETVCPHIFQPRGLANEGDGNQFWRNYQNTDTVMQMHSSGMVTYRNVFMHGEYMKLGFVDALEKALPTKAQACP